MKTGVESTRAQRKALEKSISKGEEQNTYQFKALALNESILRGPVCLVYFTLS